MFDAFTEVAEGDPPDAELVEQAKNGDRAALEKLMLRHQAWIRQIRPLTVSVARVNGRRPNSMAVSGIIRPLSPF